MAATGLLFDVDGTLWDSYPWYARVLAGLSGRPVNALVEELQVGRSVITLAKRCGVSDSRFLIACGKSASDLQVYPGVVDTLTELASRGTPCGVVTSLPERVVAPLLDELRLSRFFPVVIDANSVRPPKPNPAPLLEALRQMNTIANDAFYIGDRASDAETARRAGVRFAWAAYGYGDECPVGSVAVLNEFREALQL